MQHEIIKYLNERAEYEVTWLETLESSNVPTTLIWGDKDEIAPVSVPDFFWENYLADKDTQQPIGESRALIIIFRLIRPI